MPFLADMYHDHNAAGSPVAGDGARSLPGAFDRERFIEKLSGCILGQPEAIEAVARAVAIAHAGLADPERPLASILLVGPTGVGKTELVRQVAAELRSGPDDLCRIDMAALSQEHYAASLSGAPPGYAGSKESFTLFDKNAIHGDSYTPGIVLLDEIEKADTAVIRALLHVLDSGQLRLANGREQISFRNCYVFITSNLGSHLIAERARAGLKSSRRQWITRSPKDRRAAESQTLIYEEVEKFFDPEFFNRIDETVILNPLDTDTARRVTRREIGIIERRLARESVRLLIEPAVIEHLLDRGVDPVYGARGLRRVIRREFVDPISVCVLRERPVGQRALRLQVALAKGAVVVSAASPDDPHQT